jgi:hypothetical integral membrane protein (TIGR02206 family)
MRHVTMDPFTQEWWICISIVLGLILVLTNLPKYTTWARHPNYGKLLGAILLLNLLIENWYSWTIGTWSVRENLPLHLCGISGLIAIISLFRYNAILANLLFYWGITGGFHSLLTPEFDLGRDGYLYYGYFISHGGLLLASIFLIKHRDFRPDKGSWMKAFVFIQFAVLVIGSFNWVTGSNYMYLLAPPIVDNPLIVGKWPWYILVFEGLAILHFLVLYGIFHYKNITKSLSNLLTI